MNTHTTRLGLTAAAGLMLGLASLTGCGSNGQYTSEGIKLAEQRLNVMKAATEWEMAHQQFMSGNLDKAIKTVDRSIELSPEVARSYTLRGRILMEQQMLNEARDAFMQAEEFDAEDPEIQYYIGIIHERFSEPDVALERYTKALELGPDNPQYLIAAAEMLFQLDRLDQAEQLLTDYRDNFEYDAGIRQTFGHLSMLRGDSSKAVEYFKQAILLQPDDTQILEDLVQAQMKAGQLADAEFNITRLIDASEEPRRDLMHMQSRCLVALNRPVEARAVLIELTDGAEGQRDLQAWIELGSLAYTLKDARRMARAADRVMALAPDQYEGYFLKSAWYRMKGNLDSALMLSDEAASRSVQDPGPLVLKGLILQEMGQTVGAMDAFGEALVMDPSNDSTRQLYKVLEMQSAVAGVDND